MFRVSVACVVVLSMVCGIAWAAEEPAGGPSRRAGIPFGASKAPVPRPAPTVPAEAVPFVAAKDGAAGHVRTVLELRASPAHDIAKTLNQLFRAEGEAVRGGEKTAFVVIVPEVVSNRLLLSGPPEALREVERLVRELDQPASMVLLEVVLGEAPVQPKGPEAVEKSEKPEKAKALRVVDKPQKMEVIARSRLTTMSNQPAFLQVGSREARITGSSMSTGGMVNQIALENVGWLVSMTPRVGSDGAVTMELDVEDSRLAPTEQGVIIVVPKDGEPVRSPRIETMMLQGTVRVQNGQTITMAANSRNAKPGTERLIAITARILPGGKP
jgi:type II secretory pathway component GspD/PulD (secretin)